MEPIVCLCYTYLRALISRNCTQEHIFIQSTRTQTPTDATTHRTKVLSMQSLQTSNCPTHIEDGSRLPALKSNEGYDTFHPTHEVVIQGDQRNSHVRVLRSHNNARLLLPALNVVCA